MSDASLMIKEFHESFEIPHDQQQRDLRCKLIAEENKEIQKELKRKTVDRKKMAKELADLMYVTYGTAYTWGIDLDVAYAVVHESNMSKLGDDGKPIRRDDGKILKGPNYFEPDMSAAIKEL